MSPKAVDSARDLKSNERRLDRLLGRRVIGRNNEPIGRIEEFRADKHGTGCVITQYVIGQAGLLERLGLGVRLLIGRKKSGGYLARWDQLDISDPDRPRLKCPASELQKL